MSPSSRQTESAAHDVRLQGKDVAGQCVHRPRKFLRMHQPGHLRTEQGSRHAKGVGLFAQRLR